MITSQGENALCKSAGAVLSRSFLVCHKKHKEAFVPFVFLFVVFVILFSEIPGAVTDFEFFFFQLGIC